MKKKPPFDKGKGPAKQGAGAFKAFFSKPGKGRGSEKMAARVAKHDRGEDFPSRERKEDSRGKGRGPEAEDRGRKPFSKRPGKGRGRETRVRNEGQPGPRVAKTRPVKGSGSRAAKARQAPAGTPAFSLNEPMRLNKYMAHAGIASRRAADAIIAAGEVMVNGTVVVEMGHKVQPGDVVTYLGKQVKPVGKRVYILLNKPRDYITTTNDEKDRHTVMELVSKATDERIYPVGRLDRNTTGLLLLTNDGELAQKLMHPSHKIRKIYLAVLDKPLEETDMEKIRNGLMLEDGRADIDVIDYADGQDRKQVGVELHIGKNRIVRRIFEHLGYDVVRLDRVFYAGLTKKDLPRGRWRNLEEKEVIMLKHFT